MAGIGFAILFNLWIVPKKDKEEKKERADLFLCVKLKSELMFNAIRKYVASLSDFQFLQDGGVLVGNTLIPESKYKVEVVSDEEHMPSKGRWVVFDIASHDETGAEDIRLCKEIAIVSPRVPGWYTVHPISTHGKKVANSCSLQYDLKIQRRSQYMALMLLLASIGEYDLLEFYIKSCASAVCCGANNTIPSVFKSRMEWKNICSDQERWKITEKMHLYAEHMNLDEQSLSFLAALEAMEEKPVYLGARVKDIIKRRYYRMQAGHCWD